jgi:hypothetical protein
VSEHIHDAPAAGAAAVFEMTVNRGIGPADNALLDLADGFVLVISIGNRVFGTLLEVEHDRHYHRRAARLARMGGEPP